MLFSIRNWAVVEMLPPSDRYNTGRTVPIKFSLRISAEVDPKMPFVYNENLEVRIFENSNPNIVLQSSLYGDTATDYRIDSEHQHYITNFQTGKNVAEYAVEIRRTVNDFLLGIFSFETTSPGRGRR